MDTQTIINSLLALVAFFGGVWVRGLSDSMKALQVTDKELVDKVQSIELLVAGKYVPREELKAFEEALFKKLDRIESKIDEKADK